MVILTLRIFNHMTNQESVRPLSMGGAGEILFPGNLQVDGLGSMANT